MSARGRMGVRPLKVSHPGGRGIKVWGYRFPGKMTLEMQVCATFSPLYGRRRGDPRAVEGTFGTGDKHPVPGITCRRTFLA